MWKVMKATGDWTHIRYTLPDDNMEPVTHVESKEELIDSILYTKWVQAMIRTGKQASICRSNFFEDFCMTSNGEFVKEDVAKDYNVSVNSIHSRSFDSESEAWSYIGKFPMGSCYVVTDYQGETRPEFVPF